MCGILGWVGHQCSRSPATERVARGLSALEHRGPDGSRLEPGDDWVLGHTRLAILDLTDRASQPMPDGCGRWIVFNGEIYNFRELREELKDLGVTFHSTGDAEVLLQAISHWGVAALPRLRGMFAFGWIDPAARELILARDRYGVKPLAWERTADGVRFASDLFALDAMAGGPQTREIDPESARRYLLLGHIPAPLTIWRNVHKLLPGHYLRVRWQPDGTSTIEDRSYWSLSAVPPAGGTDEPHASEQFMARAREAVKLRLISDVPVGLLLSGGIDSSLVASVCAEIPDGQVPSFTMGFDDAASDERPYARAIARHLGLKHEEFLAERMDINALFEDVWRAFDEPFADSSALPMLILCREMRRRVKVAIGGDGGDEVWCGYPWHRALHRTEKLFFIPHSMRRLLGMIGQFASGSFAYKSRVLSAGDRLEAWTALKTGLNDRMARWLPIANAGAAPLREIFRAGAGRVGDVPDALDWACRMDLTTYLPDNLMVKADRASMRSGLELREPLLDHEFTRWGLSLPTRLRFNEATGQGKCLARDYLVNRLPAGMLDRAKQGFTPPLKNWLNGPLRAKKEEAITSLESGRLAPFALPPGAASWKQCAAGLDDVHDQFLWRILCFHGWMSARQAAA